MSRQAKIDHATRRGGKPMIALTPNNWALILRLLDEAREELWETNDHDDGMLALAINDVINRIEDQL